MTSAQLLRPYCVPVRGRLRVQAIVQARCQMAPCSMSGWHTAGESYNAQGKVNTSEGCLVRAFHGFTLLSQTAEGKDLTKGRGEDEVLLASNCLTG